MLTEIALPVKELTGLGAFFALAPSLASAILEQPERSVREPNSQATIVSFIFRLKAKELESFGLVLKTQCQEHTSASLSWTENWIVCLAHCCGSTSTKERSYPSTSAAFSAERQTDQQS